MGKKSKRESALPRVGASPADPDSHSAHSAQCLQVSQDPQVSPYPEIRFLEACAQPLNYRISRVAIYEAIWNFIVNMFSLLYSALMKIAFSQSYTPVSAPESCKGKSSPALTQSATQRKPDRSQIAKGPR